MSVLKRAAVAAPPILARETVTVPELGGDVVVIELLLDFRLDFEDSLRTWKGGQSRRAVNAIVPHLLASAVVIEGDEPLFSAEEWRAFGAKHRDAAINLFNVAMRLNGFGGEGDAAKN